MNQSINIENFDNWMSWSGNSYKFPMTINSKTTPRKLNESISGVCMSLGLRPSHDFQVTTYEVRFRTKTFLAMFKMNYNNG